MLLIVLASTIAALFMVITVWAWLSIEIPKAESGISTEPVLIDVASGMTLATLAHELEQRQLIRSEFWFGMLGRFKGATLQPGAYFAYSSQSSSELLSMFTAGDVAEKSVTLPEGWRSEEIADRLSENGIINSRQDLRSALQSTEQYPALVERLNLKEVKSLEGFLFPDTYRFALDSSGDVIVKKFVTNFLKRTEELSLSYDTVILASIVEREARYEDDRAMIAGVYANRLRQGMALNADPTVQYAKASRDFASCLLTASTSDVECATVNWWPVIQVRDYREVDSPFNTYQYAELPPAPIANPGLAALRAATKPAKHNYLYFVTDAEGHAHYAETMAGHEANKRAYLK